MDLQVRAATADDLDLMARWAQAMAIETEDKALDADIVTRGIAAGLADPGRARYYVASVDDEAAGTLMLTTEWSDWRNGWWWWIQSVYVPPGERRTGVFAALYDHASSLARATPGVIGLRLYVERANAAAQRTYASLGMDDAGYLVFEQQFSATDFTDQHR